MIRQPSYDPMKNYGSGSHAPFGNQFPMMPRQVMGLNTQQILDNLLPASIVLPYGGDIDNIPSGWLLCNGQAVSRQNYTRLFSAIGVVYGAGDGATFNVPDMRGRVPVGYDVSQAEFNVLGETGGAKTHTLTTAEIPAHTHTMAKGNDNNLGGDYGWQSVDDKSGSFATDSTGGGGSHNNLQPYLALNFIIKT